MPIHRRVSLGVRVGVCELKAGERGKWQGARLLSLRRRPESRKHNRREDMSKVNFKYENGDTLMDKVTGLVGVVMVRAEYSTGCHHYGIQPQKLESGKALEWDWLDQSRLELVSKNAVKFDIEKGKPASGAFPAGPQG